MKFYQWMNSSLPSLVEELNDCFDADMPLENRGYMGMAGRDAIFQVLDDLLAILFPGCYSREFITREELYFFLQDKMRHVSLQFLKQLKLAYKYNYSDAEITERSERTLIHMMESMPHLRGMLMQDIRTAYAGDPAASGLDEIILSYPFIEAVATHRIAHILYNENVPIIPRLMSERAHSRTGIDIHPGARIQPGFFIDHGTGVVIGETCAIGRNVKIYQGVTLGAVSPFDKDGRPRKGKKRHPDIEDDVIIYSNATILGGRTVIGKGSIIGGNTWITSSVPPGSIIYRDGSGRNRSQTP